MEVHIFTCDLCPKTFRSKQTLLRHVRIHKYGKQFRCCYCEKSYTRRYLLTDHKVRCHGVEKAPQVPIWLPKTKTKVDVIKRKYFSRPSAASLVLYAEGRTGHTEGEQVNVENENECGEYQGETSGQMSPDDGSSLIISNVQSLSETGLLQSGNRRSVQTVDNASYGTEGNIQSSADHENGATADAYMVHEFHEQSTSGTSGNSMPHPISVEMINVPDEHSRDEGHDPKGSNKSVSLRQNTEVGADAMSTTDTEESSRLERLLTEGFSSPNHKGERDSPSKFSSTSSVNDLKTSTASASRQGKISAGTSSGKSVHNQQSRQVITTRWGCDHCGIYFTDQVLYFLHSGFHARSNPFQCNSCGHISQNKYEFNTHIYSQKHY